MSETKKDLKYYLDHPDEMPEDPKVIEQLAQEHMQASFATGAEEIDVERFAGKAEPEAKETEPKVEPKETPKETPKEAKEEPEPKKEEPEAQPKPEGVLAKDGRNVIPYAVLESERERRAAAERLAAEQAAELERLKAQKPEEVKTSDVEMLSDDELKTLEAEMPTLAKLLKSQQSAIEKLTNTLDALQKHQVDAQTEEAAAVRSDVQDAIDANPTLSAWQRDKDQTMFNKAVTIDRAIRALPSYAKKSFDDRFADVVELAQRAEFAELPEDENVVRALIVDYALGQLRTPKSEPKVALTQEQIKAAAEAKLAKAKAKTPLSLSDIPGGAPPAADERERVEQMSASELGAKLLRMTREQQDAYLASL